MKATNSRSAAVQRGRQRANRLTPVQRDVQARFDLTSTTHENKRHWADSDALSGRAAYYKQERKTARERSRMEAANNSWYAGILRTACNHIIGPGPRLKMMTADTALNARVEKHWRKWSREINLPEKLRLLVETYWRDGEAFLMRAHRPSLDPIKLDIRMYEADQVAMPYAHIMDPTIEDGIRVDALGNPVEYWVYDNHPGDLNIGHTMYLKGSWYEADLMIHLFRRERPGQLRGWPRCAPALDWLAHMRRFGKATLSAAEAAAVWGVFVTTTGSQMAARMPEDFMAVDFERNMMNFLPSGWKPDQIDPKHPATTDEMFQRTGLMYFSRCTNMPYSLACGSSKDSNFAAAKMDIKNTWEPEVVSEQSLVDINAMKTVFRWFLEEIALLKDSNEPDAPYILDGAPSLSEIEYRFFFPSLPVSDEKATAEASAARITTGVSTFSVEAAAQGLDDDALCEMAARDNGVTVQQYRQARFQKTFGVVNQTAGTTPPQPGPPAATVDEPAEDNSALLQEEMV